MTLEKGKEAVMGSTFLTTKEHEGWHKGAPSPDPDSS